MSSVGNDNSARAPFIISGPATAAASAGSSPGTLALEREKVITVDILPGFRTVKPLGVVCGLTVRSRNAIASIGAGLKSLVGGEIGGFTRLCEDAREEALKRMCEQAAELGAQAVVGVRYDANGIVDGMTEVVAYGVALGDGSVPWSAVVEDPAPSGLARRYVCTSNILPLLEGEHFSMGLVQGLTVRSVNAFRSIGAGLKGIVGGEIKTFTNMCQEARREAYDRMVADAAAKGAKAIVAMRYDTNEVSPGVTEVLAYGTALLPIPPASAPGDLRMSSTPGGVGGQRRRCCLGLVKGITVQTKNVISTFGANLKNLVGGEIYSWSSLCQDARKAALARMEEEARALGAQEVLAVRYDCNQIAPGQIEVIAYGTAVADQPGALPASSSSSAAAAVTIAVSNVTTDLQLQGFDGARSLGIARGVAAFTVNGLRAIGAGLKAIVGGEVRNFSAMCEGARKLAFDRLLEDAGALGATGLTSVRYASHCLDQGVIEVVAYGTAVALEPPQTQAVGDELVLSTSYEDPRLQGCRSLGVVRGITVRSRNVVTNIGAGLVALFTGQEVPAWTKLCDAAREEALARMRQHALEAGAQGVIGVRFETNELAPGLAEVLAYGTAVSSGALRDPPLFAQR